MLDINRIILIVLDSVGVGELPDADKYNDVGANTLGHIFKEMGEDFFLENMGKLGLYNVIPSPYGYKPKEVIGCYGKMATLSPAKDTTAGHWELSGIVLDKPFPTYPNGFPKDLIEEFEKQIGTKVLGNCVASGTEIIQRLGEEHLRTLRPIVYTSADSVFQIAAEETTFFGLGKLYNICEIARKLLVGEHAVGRVIARPFIKIADGMFERTPNRRDYSLSPTETTILDKISNINGAVTAIGKIDDIFNMRGISAHYHTTGNSSGIQKTIDSIINPKIACSTPEGKKDFFDDNDPARKKLIFTNLVDFDMLWGHRRNVDAYAQGLMFFDRHLPNIMEVMCENDLLIITADHGCDPTYTKHTDHTREYVPLFVLLQDYKLKEEHIPLYDPTYTKHTDHTREYVPLLVYSPVIKQNVNLGTRKTLADIAQTIADIFEIAPMKNGTSFKDEIL